MARRSIAARAWGVMARFATDEAYRNAALIRFLPPAELFQPDNYTEVNRYPELFALAAHLIGDGPDRRLLSFGCSTGEEVFSLRCHFAKAQIEGVDVNTLNIAAARRRLAGAPDPGITFRTAGTVQGEAWCDAAFAMAVFRHGRLADRLPLSCDGLIRFADFERGVRRIANAIKPGGLLVIVHSNFRFEETACMDDFDAIDTPQLAAGDDRTPIYDRDNRRIDGPAPRHVVFRKRS